MSGLEKLNYLNRLWTPKPTAFQVAAMFAPHKEALFSGDAGAGKTEALLMSAVIETVEPNYEALLITRTYTQLLSLARRIDQSLRGDDCHKIGEKLYRLSNNAKVRLAFIDRSDECFRFDFAEFGFIGFDHLTSFALEDYLHLMSRLRLTPMKIRATAQGGGEWGTGWVADYFATNSTTRLRLSMSVLENPHVSKEHAESLKRLVWPNTKPASSAATASVAHK